MRDASSDTSDSSDDGVVDETFSDGASEGDFSETDIDIGALHESCQAQGVAREIQNEGEDLQREYVSQFPPCLYLAGR